MQWYSAIHVCVKPGAGDGEAANLDNVSHADDEEHDPEVEALHNVGTGELEQVILFKALEHGALDLDKLVRQEQGQERVGV